MAIVQREVRKRGFLGKIIKWFFIAFNLMMAFWLIAVWSQLFGENEKSGYDAGDALTFFFGTGVLLVFWVLGDIVLGLLVLLSRGKRLLITEEQ